MKPLRICLVMFGAPFDNVRARLQRRIKLFGEISDAFYLLIDKMPKLGVSKENVKIVDLDIQMFDKGATRRSRIWSTKMLVDYARIQANMCLALLRILGKVDIAIFATGIPFVLPLILLARISGKKVVVMGGGTAFYSSVAGKSSVSFWSRIVWILETICYNLSTTIAAETETASRFLRLDRFRDKVQIFGSLTYVDTDIFKKTCRLEDRTNTVGYVGDLTIGKGVMEFLDSIRFVTSEDCRIAFLIVGGGALLSKIEDVIENEKLQDRVEIIARVPHHTVPEYLNKLNLLVLPSYSEGLPGIILEAMACGTPVLATPVGGIPDVIRDGEIGFIMENNSPECIAKNILRALDYQDLSKVVANAEELIKNEFSYEPTARRYQRILRGLIT